ncbi:MAG: formylglycine-generating enzyme family protein [Magnetococcus sp. MYC-9]
MFFHVSGSISGRCGRSAPSPLRRMLSFLLLIGLLCPWSGHAFPVKEWDKLDVDGAQQLPSAEVQPGKPWQEPLSGMTFAWIPGGCFRMGSAPNAEDRDADEEPIHTACLSGFWLGEREVTQQQWQRVLQHNPSHLHREIIGQRDEGFPVENITRLDVETFIARLNLHHQGQIAINLPTEAQWEYACRNGGEKIPFSGRAQLDQLGWYQANSSGISQSTGTRRANRLGLYDMSGNVWEWVRDTYDKDAYGRHGNTDPVHTGESPFAVIRGGGWQDLPSALRCANRGFERLTNKRSDLGLRLAASLESRPADTGGKQPGSGRSKMPF